METAQGGCAYLPELQECSVERGEEGKQMIQGQHREGTPRKQVGFSLLLNRCRRLSNAKKCRELPYWHVDLNSGCGYNDKADCDGSPLVFLDEFIHGTRRFNALFCDNNVERIEQLRAKTYFAVERSDGSSLRIQCGDNLRACHDFAEWIAEEDQHPELAVGSWLCDPNGKNDIPLDGLKFLCRRFRRVDAILNTNVSLWAMIRKCKGKVTKYGTPWGFDGCPDPVDVLGLRPYKKYWLVRNPLPQRGKASNAFVIFFGSNHSAASKGFEQFYPIDSPQGEQIVRHLKRVQPEQRWLFEDLWEKP